MKLCIFAKFSMVNLRMVPGFSDILKRDAILKKGYSKALHDKTIIIAWR